MWWALGVEAGADPRVSGAVLWWLGDAKDEAVGLHCAAVVFDEDVDRFAGTTLPREATLDVHEDVGGALYV